MILTSRSTRAIFGVIFAIIGALYAAAWFAPAVAQDHESGMNLVLAKALASGHGYMRDNLPQPVPETDVAPLFPAVLALLTLVSGYAAWLKLLPLACTVAWLWLTRRLLTIMGASGASALLLIALAAATPVVISLSTSLLPHTMFALLATAAMLSLLEDRPWLTGLFAGLATLTLTAGWSLIAACLITLTARRRLRSAAIVTALASLLAAPWLGWSLAHVTGEAGLRTLVDDNSRYGGNILAFLPANEKLVVLTHNIASWFGGPAALLSGDLFVEYSGPYSAAATAILLLWCLYKRRNLLPDLFIALYGIAVVILVHPPKESIAPVLPLMLWVLWRALSTVRNKEALAAVVIIVSGFTVYADAVRTPALVTAGMFPATAQPANDWRAMRQLFLAANNEAAPGAIILGNSDATFFLNTGRKTVRGFRENSFALYYGPRAETVSPELLASAIQDSQATYVAVTPDRDRAESPSFHRAVEALERGGVLRPMEVPGSAAGYRLLRVAAAGL